MTTFTIESYGGTGQLQALNGIEGTPALDGTSVTYTDPVNFPGLVLTLTGTGITGTPSNTWDITGISATFNGRPAWTLTGLNGIDGTPTSGAFDSASIFQALVFHDTFDLIFGHDSTLIGSPIAHSTVLFGGPGNDVLIARGGNTRLDGGGGFDTLFGGKAGHDVFEFNSRLDSSVNLDTIRGPWQLSVLSTVPVKQSRRPDRGGRAPAFPSRSIAPSAMPGSPCNGMTYGPPVFARPSPA
jgi:Ca2+-binding RTX toxin-like protein